MINETKKILDKNRGTATCAESCLKFICVLNIDLKNKFRRCQKALQNSKGCKIVDEHKDGGYSTPVEAEGKDETFISRIRVDNSNKNSINLWIVSDNLLRGAALNAVEIAEALYNNK